MVRVGAERRDALPVVLGAAEDPRAGPARADPGDLRGLRRDGRPHPAVARRRPGSPGRHTNVTSPKPAPHLRSGAETAGTATEAERGDDSHEGKARVGRRRAGGRRRLRHAGACIRVRRPGPDPGPERAAAGSRRGPGPPALTGAARARRRVGGDAAREPAGDHRLVRLRERRAESRRPGPAADGAGGGRHDRGSEDRTRQEHVPGAEGADGRRADLRLRHPLPVPGARGGRRGRAGSRPRLHHPDQPRRRHGAPGDADGLEGRGRRGPRDHRRLDLGPVRPAPAVHHRGPRRADLRGRRWLPLTGGGRLRIARPRWLRGDPQRPGRKRLDRRGPEPPQQGRHEGQAAGQLHLPLRAREPSRSRSPRRPP